MFTSAVDANQYFLRISEGGKLVLKALEFGAFAEGTECQEIADELMRQSQLPFQNNLVPTPAGKVPIKYLTAWFAVVDPCSLNHLETMYRKAKSLLDAGHLSGDELIVIDKDLKSFFDIMGACERIKNTPYSFLLQHFSEEIYFLLYPYPADWIRGLLRILGDSDLRFRLLRIGFIRNHCRRN